MNTRTAFICGLPTRASLVLAMDLLIWVMNPRMVTIFFG
jgi:hypothetical protein